MNDLSGLKVPSDLRAVQPVHSFINDNKTLDGFGFADSSLMGSQVTPEQGVVLGVQNVLALDNSVGEHNWADNRP